MIQVNSKIHLLVCFFIFMYQYKSNYPVELEVNEEKPFKLKFLLDVGTMHILIQSKDIDCDKLANCTWFNHNTNTATYRNQKYTYKEAYLKVTVPDFDSHDKSPHHLRIFVRLTDSMKFNVLGVNDVNSLTNYMEHGYEIIYDFYEKTIGMRTISTESGRPLH